MDQTIAKNETNAWPENGVNAIAAIWSDLHPSLAIESGILDTAGVYAGIEAVGHVAPIHQTLRRAPGSDMSLRGGDGVLTVSPEAAALVRQLVETADLPDGAGVRIILDSRHHSLSMGLAHGPEPQDRVISSDGAHIFLSPPATGRLGSRTLNAEVTDLRSAFFLSD